MRRTQREESELWHSYVRQELAQIGIVVQSMSHVRNSPLVQKAAIPVLTRLLPIVPDASIKQDIVFSLSTKLARGSAGRVLVEEFERLRGFGTESLKWSIAAALAEAADESVQEDVARLWLDRSHYSSRQMLAYALKRCKHPEAEQLLIQRLDDHNVVAHAVHVLGLIGAGSSRAHIEPLLKHENALVRKNAKVALERIERREAKNKKKKQM